MIETGSDASTFGLRRRGVPPGDLKEEMIYVNNNVYHLYSTFRLNAQCTLPYIMITQTDPKAHSRTFSASCEV